MTEQATRFGKIAGQLIASGIDVNMPQIALEGVQNPTVFKNLEKINGLMPKISDTIIQPVKVFQSPIDRMVRRMDTRYGAAVEMAMFLEGAKNEKNDGTCVGRGTPSMDSVLMMSNFAYSVDVDIKDHEVDKAVLNDAQAGSYVAQKMRTQLKTISSMKYRAWIQVLSDVIDGSRSISSTTKSDGTGSAVTYAPTVEGWAGKVDAMDEIQIAPVAIGSKASVSAADALKIANQLKSVVADFAFESTAYNKLGADTFSLDKPWLVMEKKVLDACDTAFAEYNLTGADSYGFAGFPTVSFRQYVGEFADIVEIDSFGDLPTNAEYSGMRIAAELFDKDALYEIWKWADVEGQRCSKGRLTGYNAQGEATLAIWKGVNSYALLVDADTTATYLATFVDSDAQGGAVIGKVRVNAGEKITFTKTPPGAPSGKVFDKYVDGSSQAFVSGTTTIAADTTFTASYKNAPA